MLGNFALVDVGTPELIIFLAIILVLFGGKRLPELTKNISKSIMELRKGFKDEPETSKKKNESR